MTTAREQARIAGIIAVQEMGGQQGAITEAKAEAAAHAASDVWEPIVRSLVEALECDVDGHEDDHARLVAEAKEALG